MVTSEFLDHFGLESARDLPGLKELRAAGLLESRPPPGEPLEDEADNDEVIEAPEDVTLEAEDAVLDPEETPDEYQQVD